MKTSSEDVWLRRTYSSWSRRLEDILKLSSEDKDKRRLQDFFIKTNVYWDFTFIAKEIEENLIKPKLKYSEDLKKPNASFFFMSPTKRDGVLSVIKELKYNKSKEPSSIPSKFLKLFETALSNPTSLTINFPFSSGTFLKF